MDNQANISIDGPYKGLNRFVARKRILEDLEAQGLLGTIREHKLSIGRCDRSKDIVEPRLSEQWFVAVNKTVPGFGSSMAARAIDAVKQGHIKFTPAMYEKTWLNWMENIHDWCISRQLWWGHRIPAWHCATCHKITVPKPGQPADPTACEHCHSPQLTQETDVLDTWFSSGLLPISVFNWPFLNQAEPSANDESGDPGPGVETKAGAPHLASEMWASAGDINKTPGAPSFPRPSAERVGPNIHPDFDAFYPTNLLITGFDILFFWVARMIMLGCWFTQDIPLPDGSPRTLKDSVPFREVYIHALVRDAHGDKMSKTKGNVVDPIETVKQYGTDAVRFTLASMASPGTDIAFNIARTEGYRAFANKIWNAARFIFMNVDRAAEVAIVVDPNTFEAMPSVPEDAPLEARWIVAEFHKTASEVNAALENYRFDEAANTTYQFFWGSFCDWYLEIVKLRLDFSETADKKPTEAALTTLLTVFEASLRLLSPFMPFLTEEIWQAVYDGAPPHKSIALTAYPSGIAKYFDEHVEQIEMSVLQFLISEIRTLRKEVGVEEKSSISIELRIEPDNKAVNILTSRDQDIIHRLAKVSEIFLVDEISSGLTKHSTHGFDVAVIYEREIDIPAERDRLTKEIAKLEKNLLSSDRQLSNEAFLAKAPPPIVEGLKKQQSENASLLAKAKAALAALPPA